MIEEIMQSLSPPEVTAVQLLKMAMDAHNSADGTGLFQGVSRYDVLQGRAKLAAVRSQTIMEFWSHLHTSMLWDPPPGRFDAELMRMFSVDHGIQSLSVISNQCASIIAIARTLHTTEKKKRIAEKRHGLDWEIAEAEQQKKEKLIKPMKNAEGLKPVDTGSLFDDLETEQ